MDRKIFGGPRLAIAIVVGLFLLSQPAKAQVKLDKVAACKNVILVEQPLFGGAVIARHLETRDCGDRFTTTDRYVGLVCRANREGAAEAGRILEAVLLDPEQNKVWEKRIGTSFPPPAIYGAIDVWGILPIAADPAELSRQMGPILAVGLIRIDGKPARERLGEWTFKVSLTGGEPTVIKFVLGSATP